MSPRHARILAVLVALPVIVLAGCGGDDGGKTLIGSTTAPPDEEATSTSAGEGDDGDESGDDTEGTEATDTTETTEATDTSESTEPTETTGDDGAEPADPDDTELARSAALTLDDMPAGWKLDDEDENTGNFGSTEDEEFQQGCPEVYSEIQSIIDAGGEPADVSRSFSKADGMPSVESSPAVFDDDSLAERAFEVVVGGGFADCVTEVLAGDADGDGAPDVAASEVTPLPLDAGPLDDAGGFELRADFDTGGVAMTTRYTIIVLRSGRLLHMVVLLSIDEMAPFPEAQDVIDAAIARTASV